MGGRGGAIVRRRIDSTPRLIEAKYAGTCACGAPIKVNDEVLYYPSARKVECRYCATETLNALADERANGGW